MIFDGFIGGMSPNRSRLVDLQECVNWYPEITTEGAKSRTILRPTPGTTLFSTISISSPIRSIYGTSTGRCFACINNQLYEVFANGTNVSRGPIKSNLTNVSMADNGKQLMLVDGTYGYILNLETNGFYNITSEYFPRNCSHVQFINGRFVVNKSDVNQYNLFWSDLYDGLSWSGDVASAEGYADKLISIGKLNNQLWLFGDLSTEVFYDTGDTDQPYQRIQGAFFDNGTSAPFSVATTGSMIFWLGSNMQGSGIVWGASAYEPKRISTHAIEYLIQSFTRIDDAVGYCYQQEGHIFYVLTFPSQNRTLVYDITTGSWHERTYYSNISETDDRHIGNCATFAFGKTLLGSKNPDGKIYYYDSDSFTDAGVSIRRIRTSPHINKENSRLFYKSLELDIEKGIGLTTGQGCRPRIMLKYSNDGGYNWSNELWSTAGLMGNYITRVKWFNLGMSRDKLFRVIYTDPVKCTMLNAYIDVEAEYK